MIKPMVNDLYDDHASDPLTAGWFGEDRSWTVLPADMVKEHVFTFFGSGIGGPETYNGRSLVKAHGKMLEQNPISPVAFHAVSSHVMAQMEAHGSGGEREREEVLAILYSLRNDVMFGGKAECDA